jgi:myosin heavy subunit
MVPRDFLYLGPVENRLERTSLNSVDAIKRALAVLNIAQEEEEQLFDVLYGILCVGNVQVLPPSNTDPGGHRAAASHGTVTADTPTASVIHGQCTLKDTETDTLKMAMLKWGLPETNQFDTFVRTLTCSSIAVRSTVSVLAKKPDVVVEERDMVAKKLYNGCFLWLLHQINRCLAAPATLAETSVAATHNSDRSIMSTVTILDMFGFETLQRNSFTQFCINWANEKLQTLFVKTIFAEEVLFYDREAVVLPPNSVAAAMAAGDCGFHFHKHADALDIIDMPGGVLEQLNDASRLGGCAGGRGDVSFVSRMRSVFAGERPHACFKAPDRTADFHSHSNLFIIRHSASDITYDAAGFVPRNTVQFNAHLSALFRSSRNVMIRGMFENGGTPLDSAKRNFVGSSANHNSCYGLLNDLCAHHHRSQSQAPPPPEGLGSTRRPQTHPFVVTVFKEEMAELLGHFDSTHKHFVRCFRLNSERHHQIFDTSHVRQQLQCHGIVEALQVRQSGWPYRISYVHFYDRYKDLVMHIADPQLRSPLKDPLKSDLNYMKLLSRKILSLYWALNPSLKQADREQLFQFGVTMVCMRKRLVLLLESDLKHQLRKHVNAGTLIQACVRRYLYRRRFVVMAQASKCIQHRGRLYISLLKQRREQSSGLKIHFYLRMYVCRQRYKKTKCSVSMLQKWWRGEFEGFNPSTVTVRHLQCSAKRLVLLHHLRVKIARASQIQVVMRRFLSQCKLDKAKRVIGNFVFRCRSWRQFQQEQPTFFAEMQRRRFERSSTSSILVIQTYGRSLLAKKRAQRMLFHIRTLQRWVRARLEYEAFHWTIVSVIFIQSMFRSWKAVSKRQRLLAGTIRLQRRYMGWLGKRRYQSIREATRTIQSWSRGLRTRHHVARLWSLLPRIQALARRKMAVLRRNALETEKELSEETRKREESQANENNTLQELRDIVTETSSSVRRGGGGGGVLTFVGFDDWHAGVKGPAKSNLRALDKSLHFPPGAPALTLNPKPLTLTLTT